MWVEGKEASAEIVQLLNIAFRHGWFGGKK